MDFPEVFIKDGVRENFWIVPDCFLSPALKDGWEAMMKLGSLTSSVCLAHRLADLSQRHSEKSNSEMQRLLTPKNLRNRVRVSCIMFQEQSLSTRFDTRSCVKATGNTSQESCPIFRPIYDLHSGFCGNNTCDLSFSKVPG